MRLSNLDDCIQDAVSTREKLSSQVTDLLEEQKQAFETINSASWARDALAATERSISTSRKALKTAQSRRFELQVSLEVRRGAIRNGTLAQEKAQSELAPAQLELYSRTSLLQTTATEVSGQIRRVCEDLLSIYPIEPIPEKTLLFTIRGLPLPNASSPSSSGSETDPAATSAALSLVAHTTHLLSLYLSNPIPYPPTVHGSTSSILDPISLSLRSFAARTFPLFQKGTIPFRFEYGVFLLNSDIELLMGRQGLRMVDQRHTLPNLKYLLYVLTAGKGDMPPRKRGDVKGLLPSSTNDGLPGGGQSRGSDDITSQDSSRNESLLKGKHTAVQDSRISVSAGEA